jgi:hypothetical protein
VDTHSHHFSTFRPPNPPGPEHSWSSSNPSYHSSYRRWWLVTANLQAIATLPRLQETYVSSTSLSAVALAQVSDRLKGFGSSLRGEHRDAIQALLEALEGGLTGNLSPHYHLSAIDPGVGKTMSVALFLKTWKARAFSPASSVLIGVSRLEEIKAYLRAAELDREDVAVLTSNPEWNDLGVPQAQHGSAPVMFTTQQMIERRTREKTFAETGEFHFEGGPRRLRIWDESLVPARHLVLNMDELVRVLGVLRSQSPEFAIQVQHLVTLLWAQERPERLVVPEGLSAAPRYARHSKDSGVAEAIEKLRSLAGRAVTVVEAGGGDVRIAGASQPLPSDFAPVIILDASGRVRSTYQLWEEAGGALRRLPSATKDYSNLRVHLWERKVGQTALRTPGAIEDVATALAGVIDEDAGSDWLIVSYKAHPVEQLLRAALAADPGTRLHFLTWGMHHGTNDFAHCQRVVLIGQLSYGTSGYRALAAACGSSAEEEVASELMAGEYRHNLLQALTRASARHSENGVAGNCVAYVIASPIVGAHELLPEVFPGCTIERWSPNVPEVGGRPGQLIALLEDAKGRGERQVPKKELRVALNMNASNFSRLLKDPRVVLHLAERHMRQERTVIVIPPGFEPYPGHGFTIDQLDDLD